MLPLLPALPVMPDSVIELVGGVASVTTVLLNPLSAPAQLVARRGVTVYFHEPAGTELSTQLRAATVPVHAERMVCRASVPAS